MAIAEKLRIYLKEHEAKYSLRRHPHTGSSMETAEAAHVPGDCLAKGVVLKDTKGFGLLDHGIIHIQHVHVDGLVVILDRVVVAF